MFNGDEYQHDFSRTTSSIPSISLPFPLHASSYNTAPGFHHPYHHINNTTVDHHQILHNLQPTKKLLDAEHSSTTSLSIQSEISSSDLWSDNEVLALLKIRSSVDNWFPDLIWEHVSRKLGDLGFRRSAERCKQKFEDETRSFNNKSSARLFSLEEFFHSDQADTHLPSNADNQVLDHETNAASEKLKTSSQDNEDMLDSKRMRKKRKRSKLKKLRCFCVNMVNEMMGQQEELHKKLLQEMMERDEQKIAKQEALMKIEMERLNKEIDIRAHQQAFEGDRQAVIIDFLKKFTSNDYPIENQLRIGILQFEDLLKLQNKDEGTSSLSRTAETQNPTRVALKTPLKAAKDVEDIGKRWPKDEVLALINIRSSLGSVSSNINDQDKEKEGGSKCSLWEKISNGMSELGYKRSAKRCKEKWENINKYFRKTKDSNKKRSIESRTCPYFHQLSNLYNNQCTTTSVSENTKTVTMSESHRFAMPEKQDASMGVANESERNATHSSSVFKV